MMAEYQNKTLGVVNVGGVVIAPGKTQEVGDKSPGLERLIKRGVLVEVDAKPAPKPDAKTANKDGGKAE